MKKWILPEPITEKADQALNVFPKPIRQILFSRGIYTEEDANLYLKAGGDIDRNYLIKRIENPFLIKHMAKAVARIYAAIERKEKVAIYGDYDVDGVTATTMMVEVINQSGGMAEGYIPNRFDEGYGLNNDALDALKAKGTSLVITVDCGIRSPKEAQHAREIGLDLIITDHHHPKGDVPDAFAVLCPRQEGDEYPNKDLAGVGLAFKIVQGIWMSHPELNLDPYGWLDLVALGTIADVVNLSDENRSLVRKGIEKIRDGKRTGLVSLSTVAKVEVSKIKSFDIGFMLAPRLNASGRLESALASLELLLEKEPEKARALAEQLDKQNQERQRITRDIQARAEELVLSGEEQYLLFAADTEFNQGVVGLAASRLVEKYYRPAIVARKDENITVGSGRSIAEFHITQALDECADLLVRHGGHAMAAGFTVDNKNLDELIKRLKTIAQRELGTRIDGNELTPVLKVDAEVRLMDLTFDLLNCLDLFQPLGMGNPEPLFVARLVMISDARKMGSDGTHLRMKVSQKGSLKLDAVAFRMGERLKSLPSTADMVFSFERNLYNGLTTLQLNIKDLQPSESNI